MSLHLAVSMFNIVKFQLLRVGRLRDRGLHTSSLQGARGESWGNNFRITVCTCELLRDLFCHPRFSTVYPWRCRAFYFNINTKVDIMSHVAKRFISLYYKWRKCVIKEVSTVDALPLSSRSVVIYRVTMDSQIELR